MNTAEVKGGWQQFVERAKEKWGGLTNDDWRLIAGKRDQLLGNIQQRYGVSLEEAERKLADLVRVLTGPPASPGHWRSTGRTAR
jgi:uncharacterized protein YjbJ (UPF0337 family)